MDTNHPSDDATSVEVNIANYNTHGLCSNYTLRRHRYESEANAGCYEARSDWIRYVGPADLFGGCNPVDGNFSALALPLCKPERLRLVAYAIEYAFLLDDKIELATAHQPCAEGQSDQEWNHTDPALGKTQIQAKIMTQLTSTDKMCTQRVKHVWKQWHHTTLRDKNRDFLSLEEYMEFRMVDVGAILGEALLLFGMGITLTEEEDRRLESVRNSSYAAIGLTNDFLSFDREYDEFQASGQSQTFMNAVWLHMKWYKIDVVAAKRMVKQAAWRYEKQFLDLCAEYRHEYDCSTGHLDRYLRALAYQVSGSAIWSLNCPRYNPDRRYDPNAGLEDSLTEKRDCHRSTLESPHCDIHSTENIGSNRAPATTLHFGRRESTGTTTTTGTNDNPFSEDISSQASSRSSNSNDYDLDQHCSKERSAPSLLDDRHVRAPFDFITSLPSKGVRDAFTDALNVWLAVPESTVSRIKTLGGRLHSASLMLDDIEDGSGLRRCQPATHNVFGIAQTVNSGCREILKAVNEASQLGVPSAIDITLEALDELHVGQSYDLYWTRHNKCPSKKEYLEMVDGKTGGLFRLLARLMIAASPHRHDTHLSSSVEALVSLVGVQFQIRDDYQNLNSADYSNQKGFCEDLDEGKYSFPLIHALSCESQVQILRELLCQRQASGGLSHEHKVLILERLQQAGSFQYTKDVLQQIQGRVDVQLTRLEHVTGLENWILRALLQKLEV